MEAGGRRNGGKQGGWEKLMEAGGRRNGGKQGGGRN